MDQALSLFVNGLSPTMLGKIVSLLIILVLVLYVMRAHFDPKSRIDLSDIIVDQSGKIGGSQMRLNLAFGLSSWVIIYNTLNGTLSEWLFTAYIAAFVYDRVASRKTGGPTPAQPASEAESK